MPVHVTSSVNGVGKPLIGLFWQEAVDAVTVVFRVAELKSELKVKSPAPSGMKQPAPQMPLSKSHA